MAVNNKMLLGNIKGPKGEAGPAGPQGPAYSLTEEDRDSIADAVIGKLTPDTWVFTMDDDTTVTKRVVIG